MLSTLAFPSSGIVYSAATDPFGSVFLVSEDDVATITNGQTVTRYDLVVMKYDGLTGKRVWPAPARIQGFSPRSPFAAAVGPSGDVFVASGVTSGWATLCYDGRTGAVLWGPQLYGGGVPVDLAIDRAGDLVVTGFAASSDESLWAAIKYRGATGEQVWGPLRIGTPSTAPPPTVCPGSCLPPPTFAKCAFDRKGDMFLTVSSFTAPYAQAWLTAKYDGATGSLLWGPVSHKTGSQTDYDVPSAIAVDGNGDVVVGGSGHISYSDGSRSVNELIKYRGDTGASVWGPVTAPETVSALALDGGGHVIVGGTTSGANPAGGGNPITTTKFDGRSGATLWSNPMGEPAAIETSSPSLMATDLASRQSYPTAFVVVGSDGNVTTLVSAYVASPTDQHTELRAVRYAGSNGSNLWGPVAARHQGAWTWPIALLPDRGGDTVVVTTSGWGPGSILKYASDGRGLWGPIRFSGASSPVGWPATATLDSNGDLVIARWNLVSKYSGSSGQLLWDSAPIEGLDSRFTGVRTDAAGDVLMVAIYQAGWAVMKFRGSTGELAWTSQYQPPSSSAQPADLGVDFNGDILVTGSLYENSSQGWVTLKYSGATGNPVWGPVLFSGTYRSDAPKKLAVDAAGDVIVTGLGESPRGLTRRTVRYSGKDGAVLWGPSETLAGLIADAGATAISLGAGGDVFIVGGRAPDAKAPFPWVWSLVKLGGRTGELIWGPKDLPAPTRSLAAAMAIDPQGNPTVAGTVWNGNHDEWMLVGYDSATGDINFGPETYDTGSNESVSQIAFTGPDFLAAGTSEGLARTVRYGTSLAITTFQRDLAPVPLLCGIPFSGSLSASNGKAPVVWEILSGGLPTGLDLDAFSGQLSGTPSQSGSFSFRVRAQDAAGATADRDFTIDVADGQPYVALTDTEQDGCLPGRYTLSVPGAYASYDWLPGGETTPEISVCPFEPTIYSVTVIDSNGCERRGFIELQPFKIALVPRAPLAIPPHKRPTARQLR